MRLYLGERGILIRRYDEEQEYFKLRMLATSATGLFAATAPGDRPPCWLMVMCPNRMRDFHQDAMLYMPMQWLAPHVQDRWCCDLEIGSNALLWHEERVFRSFDRAKIWWDEKVRWVRAASAEYLLEHAPNKMT